MGDRNSSQQSPLNNGASLSDHLPLSHHFDRDEEYETTSELQQTEASLTTKLAPAQLRAVASWMRAIAITYDHQAPAEVGNSFRAQASRLDQLARNLTTEADALIGTVMSAQVAYLMTATGQYLRQTLSQPGEAEAPTEPCSEAEFRQAYESPEFTVLLGAERLRHHFDTEK